MSEKEEIKEEIKVEIRKIANDVGDKFYEMMMNIYNSCSDFSNENEFNEFNDAIEKVVVGNLNVLLDNLNKIMPSKEDIEKIKEKLNGE